MSGAISPGDKLPSVRQLAASLAINPNTIQRAYEALEQEGYVYSVPGKGSFAAHRTEMDGRRREELLRSWTPSPRSCALRCDGGGHRRRFSQVGEAPAEKGERESHD